MMENFSLECRERFDLFLEVRVAQRKRGGP